MEDSLECFKYLLQSSKVFLLVMSLHKHKSLSQPRVPGISNNRLHVTQTLPELTWWKLNPPPAGLVHPYPHASGPLLLQLVS